MLAPKAIHLLWLIVLVKSVTYLNVPYVSTKQVEAKSEVTTISTATNASQEKSMKSEMQPMVINENEKPIIENIKIVALKNENAIKTETAPSLYVSTLNYFTIDKIKTILLWSYLLILAAMLVHLLISLIRVRSLKTGGTQNDLLTKKLKSLKIKLKIKSKIEIYESNIIPSPTLIGIHSFTILIPANILGNISNANLEDIITHELMHIKRKDTLVNLIYRFVACLYFYNPVIWLAYFTMKKDMESACDQDVLIKSDFKNNISYAESLLLITKLCKQNGQVNHHAMMFIHKNTFKRIDMITNLKKPGVLSRIAFTTTVIFALIVFVPSYRVVSEEVEATSALDNINITLDNKENEETQIFFNKQLKNVLGVKNIFILIGKHHYLDLSNFKFSGTFKQFQELIFKRYDYNIVYFNESLYFTQTNKIYFMTELEGRNKIQDNDLNLKNRLSSKIKSITFSSNNLVDAINQIAKESGVEIDLISQCDYATFKVFKDAKISNNTYQDISAWSLLVGLTSPFDGTGVFGIKDGKIFLSKDVSWRKRYSEILEKQIVLEKSEYGLSDFLQLVRNQFPDLQIILQKMALEGLEIGDQIQIKVNQKNGKLKTILKDVLSQIKMDFELENQALVITSQDFIAKEKAYDETKKNFYILTNTNDNKQIDVNRLLDQPVFFDFTNTNLKDGLKELSALSGISIIFKDGVINEDNDLPIQMVANGMSFRNSLKWILANVDMDYRVYKNSILIQKKSFVEIPATFLDVSKAIPNFDKSKQNKNEKLSVIKPNKDFNLDFDGIKEIKIDNGNPNTDPTVEIISVDNNLILVKITRGNIVPGTACTIFYKD